MSDMPKLPPNNPQAFPGGAFNSAGMTLRDFIIAAAVPEAMRSVNLGLIVVQLGEKPEDAVARVARDVADAVLRIREVTP